MAYSTNFSDVTTIVPQGKYEVLIMSAYEDVTRTTNKQYIKTVLIIRNDVEQNYKNYKIYYPLWKRKNPTEQDMLAGGYGAGLQLLSRAAGIPSGVSFDSIAAWLDMLKNKPVQITLEHEEWNGELREKVRYVNASKYPDVKHKFPQFEAANMPTTETKSDFTDVDDDLPF